MGKSKLNLEKITSGKSLAWLSLKTGVSLSKLKKISSGKQNYISFDDLSKIISKTKIETNELLTVQE